MKRNTRFEVLAPAGSIESMKAAIAAGADAVYMGGVRFGARAYAENPEEDMLLAAIDTCHFHGVKLFMTVNTLLKEQELAGDLIPYLKPYADAGVDAFIVQDMGVWKTIREAFPEVPLHASTQMTITGAPGAAEAKRMGADRIVTARELSIAEIRDIHENVDVEIETFVHGAICYCYSGQCLYSSLIGGRSGNRGRCAQPCRLPYDVLKDGRKLNPKGERFPMNLKDMCSLDVLPELLEAGVYSLKIEGRMKSPRYTAGVVSIYRKYVDLYEKKGRAGYRVDAADRRLLLELFDRGGQTDDYFSRQNGRDMIALREKPAFRETNRELLDELDQKYVLYEPKEKISGKLIIRKDFPVKMVLEHEGIFAEAEGEIPQEAQKRALTEDEVRKQFSKFGGTGFELTALSVELDDGLFLPVKTMNELRRAAAAKLLETMLGAYRRTGASEQAEPLEAFSADKKGPFTAVLCEEEDQLLSAIESKVPDRIYISMEKLPWEKLPEYARKGKEAGKEVFLAFPRIYRERAKKVIQKNREFWQNDFVDGFLLRVIDEMPLVDTLGKNYRFAADHSLYSFNRKAEKVLAEKGFETDTASLELNFGELKKRGTGRSELVIYGRLPMMVSAQCFRNTLSGCDKTPGLLELVDRKYKHFPVKNYCRYCYNVVFNSEPLWLIDEQEAIRTLSPAGVRLQFSTESGAEVREILARFSAAKNGSGTLSEQGSYTRGHFRRGVE